MKIISKFLFFASLVALFIPRDTNAVAFTALDSESFKYVLELQPDLILDYANVSALGIPVGFMLPTKRSDAELKEALKQTKPDVSEKDLNDQLANLKISLEVLKKQSDRTESFLGSIRDAKASQPVDAKSAQDAILAAVRNSVDADLWINSSDVFKEKSAQDLDDQSTNTENRKSCLGKAISALTYYMAVIENLKVIASDPNAPEVKLLNLSSDPSKQTQFLSPFQREYSSLLPDIANDDFDHLPCEQYLSLGASDLGNLDFLSYGFAHDRLLVLDQIQNLASDADIATYLRFVHLAFSKASKGTASRYLWLRANTLDSYPSQRFPELADQWLKDLVKTNPALKNEVDELWKKLT